MPRRLSFSCDLLLLECYYSSGKPLAREHRKNALAVKRQQAIRRIASNRRKNASERKQRQNYSTSIAAVRRNRFHCESKGFTLIELLTVIAILAVLVGMLLPALARAKEKARFINEIHSAKQLMIAHRMYTDDNAGHLLPGYRYGFPATDRVGRPLTHPINARYPWRIAPYLEKNFEVLYVNRNRALLHSFAQNNESRYVYAASVFPSLAANSVFVGGDDLTLPPTDKAFAKFGRFCVLRESDAQRPAGLMTFLSARAAHAEFNGKVIEGFYRTTPPYLTKRLWMDEWNPAEPPRQFGFVHPRYNNRAVSAMLDGHAEGLGLDAIQDMRFWANPADQPDWTLQEQ